MAEANTSEVHESGTADSEKPELGVETNPTEENPNPESPESPLFVGSDEEDQEDDAFTLHSADAPNSESGHNSDRFLQMKIRKKTRPDHHIFANRAAERAAKRTQVVFGESFIIDEQDSLFLKDRKPASHSSFSNRRSRYSTDAGKRTAAQLNSDDDLMITMRDMGFTDEQIVDRLVKEGRRRYERKSVSTRISRIKLAQAQNVDFLLEEGYKEWEYEDDVLLMQAYEFANIEINYEIERSRAWRFKKVSDYMRRLQKDSIFSEKACRERYHSLIAGTATIPSALADDPHARLVEMEAFREQRQSQRDAEAQHKEAKAAEIRKIRQEAAVRQAEKAEATAISRQKKQQQRAGRSMMRAAQNQIKLQRAQANQETKSARLEQMRMQRAGASQKEAKRMKASNPNLRSAVRHVVVRDLKTVTEDTPDPRCWLSIEDLKMLCRERNLREEGKMVESFVHRLRDADDMWTLTQIKAMCRSKGMVTTGTKLSLKYQLALAEARRFASFEARLEMAKVEARAEMEEVEDGFMADFDEGEEGFEEEFEDDFGNGAASET